MPNDERDNAGVLAPPPLIYAGPLLLGLLLNRKLGVPFLPRGVERMLGWPLVGGGVLLIGWFFRTMRRADTPMDPREPVSRLVTTGPFRYTRNPAYLAMTMIYGGITSLANSLPSIFLLPAALLVMQRGVIEREERYLEDRFGEEYLRYKARVRRWI
jgi:protein-S-isoprenylcysteine O-methyltransferase Ste14